LHLLGEIEENSNPTPPKKNRTKCHIWFDNNVKAQDITVHNEQEDPVNRMS